MPSARTLVVASLALIWLGAVARADDGGATAPAGTSAPPAPMPSLEELEGDGLRIGHVFLHIGDVFDESVPGEHFFLFRLANRLHRTTRPEVIRRMLLFEPGDRLSAQRVEESERLLRGERFFYDAHIVPVEVGDGTVDLEVDTRDVWSLSAGFGFHRSGGVNTTRFKVEDSNLLGLGKELQAYFESNVDRRLGGLTYRDHELFGSRLRLDLEAARASDGDLERLALARPFFSLDTRWASGVALLSDDRVDTLWDLGHVTDRFATSQRGFELFAGLSPGLRDGRAQRWTAGLTWDDRRFEPVAGEEPGGVLPADRRLVYPWVGWEWVEDGFEVAHDLDKIARSEDVNLGRHAALRLGYAATSWGSSEDAAVFNGSWSDGLRLGERQLLLFSGGFDGRLGGEGLHGLLGSLAVRDYLRDAERGRLMLALRYDFSRRLDDDQQLLIGGDTGLRGYPLRFQPGDRILTATLEQRFYSERELFHLLRIGAAAFVDASRIWAAQTPGQREPYEVLRDIGVGLRVGSSRSARAAMIHLDVAYPLDGPGGISRVQWLVTTSETF